MSQKPKSQAEIAARAAVRDEFTRLAPGQIAAVITHLEMYSDPPRRPVPAGQHYQLFHSKRPDLDWYRGLYRSVGANWLWFSRLTLDNSQLATLIHNPAVEVYALRGDGRDGGILELDYRRFPDIEISFLGVVGELIGTSAGRFLLNHALDIAWARAPRRITVHTCTLDHPNALAFYVRSGFEPYARSFEVADDPRLHGLLPREAAPQIPILK